MFRMTIALVTIALGGCAAGGSSSLDGLRSSSYALAASVASDGGQFLRGGGTKDELAAKAQKTIADKLKDPNAAQFRNVVVRRYLSGVVVCGEVNGKNSYGAYVGFKRFIATDGLGQIEEPQGQYLDIAGAANAGMNAACLGPEPEERSSQVSKDVDSEKDPGYQLGKPYDPFRPFPEVTPPAKIRARSE